ncbi:U6 snRNA-associated Sm-like protein LSm1 [Smittium culicis]|uniref:U6 snRNA-associated Sm-like protein LSm1 n=1 Tax=Smittium culicis TaxID=133412 RepID=A0A1R1YMP3_9FUNG|nr:U6 snRNA-associated Sm-like protein LSm1 [Smittium culicis]
MDSNLISTKYFTTTGCLLDLVDKRVHVALRDGKKLFGVLRSFDQYGSLILQDTIERVFIEGGYGNIDRGIFIIRGENIILLGELDHEKENDFQNLNLKLYPIDQVLAIQRLELENSAKKEKYRVNKLASLGFNVEPEYKADNC